MDAQADRLLEAGIVGVDAHVADRGDPARSTVAADLYREERGPLDDRDVDPVPSEVIRGRRATRTGPTTRTQSVSIVLHARSRPPRGPTAGRACEKLQLRRLRGLPQAAIDVAPWLGRVR